MWAWKNRGCVSTTTAAATHAHVHNAFFPLVSGSGVTVVGADQRSQIHHRGPLVGNVAPHEMRHQNSRVDSPVSENDVMPVSGKDFWCDPGSPGRTATGGDVMPGNHASGGRDEHFDVEDIVSSHDIERVVSLQRRRLG